MFDKEKMQKLIDNAKNMQNCLEKSQNEIAQVEVEGSDKNGLIKIVMDCTYEVKKVTINPNITNNINTLEAVFTEAVNNTKKMVEAYVANKMINGLTSQIFNGLSKIELPV